jgi:hypothetical protein
MRPTAASDIWTVDLKYEIDRGIELIIVSSVVHC